MDLDSYSLDELERDFISKRKYCENFPQFLCIFRQVCRAIECSLQLLERAHDGYLDINDILVQVKCGINGAIAKPSFQTLLDLCDLLSVLYSKFNCIVNTTHYNYCYLFNNNTTLILLDDIANISCKVEFELKDIDALFSADGKFTGPVDDISIEYEDKTVTCSNQFDLFSEVSINGAALEPEFICAFHEFIREAGDLSILVSDIQSVDWNIVYNAYKICDDGPVDLSAAEITFDGATTNVLEFKFTAGNSGETLTKGFSVGGVEYAIVFYHDDVVPAPTENDPNVATVVVSTTSAADTVANTVAALQNLGIPPMLISNDATDNVHVITAIDATAVVGSETGDDYSDSGANNDVFIIIGLINDANDVGNINNPVDLSATPAETLWHLIAIACDGDTSALTLKDVLNIVNALTKEALHKNCEAVNLAIDCINRQIVNTAHVRQCLELEKTAVRRKMEEREKVIEEYKTKEAEEILEEICKAKKSIELIDTIGNGCC